MSDNLLSCNLRFRMKRSCVCDSLCLFPVVGGDLLVVPALAAVQRGPVDGQRQLLLWPSVCYRGFIVFCRAE